MNYNTIKNITNTNNNYIKNAKVNAVTWRTILFLVVKIFEKNLIRTFCFAISQNTIDCLDSHFIPTYKV